MSMNGNFLLVSDADISALMADPESVHALLEERRGGEDAVDVDKAWHALHFLLTGTAWEGDPPLNFIVGGTEIGDVDVGYGPARALGSAELAALDEALAAIPSESLAGRYDGPKMDALEIYPAGGWAEFDANDAAELAYYAESYDELKALIHKGTLQERGMLIWLT